MSRARKITYIVVGSLGGLSQSESHADEIELAIRERQPLGRALDQHDRKRLQAVAQHGAARIEARDVAGIADDGQRFARDEPGPGRNIQNAHSGLQAGAQQRQPPVARPTSQGRDTLYAIVVVGGAIEDLPHEIAALFRPSVVLREHRMRSVRGSI